MMFARTRRLRIAVEEKFGRYYSPDLVRRLAANPREVKFEGEDMTHAWAGNVIDLCPVGALLSKDSLNKARAWELDRASGQYYYHAFLTEQPDLN